MDCAHCSAELMPNAVYCPHCGGKQPGAVEPDDYVYEAFISYRHLPKDTRAAIRVQRALEGSRIPRGLRTEGRGKRLGRLFRDEDELSTTASLPDTIEEALRKSRYLIVICSPKTKESKWVLHEVETFASLHGRDKILTVLVEGEPYESLPPLLLTRRELDEDTQRYEEVPAEPLAANLRSGNWMKIGREIIRLQACLLECDYDQLLQRIRSRLMRTRLMITGIIAIVAVALAIFTFVQVILTTTLLIEAQQSESTLMAQRAESLLLEGDRVGAIRTSLEALIGDDWKVDRPYVTDAQLALERALGVFPTQSPWESLYVLDCASDTYAAADGLQATEGLGGKVIVSEAATGRHIASFDPSTLLGQANVAKSGLTDLVFGKDMLLCAYGDQLICIEPTTAARKWQCKLPYRVTCKIAYLEKANQFVAFAIPDEESAGEVTQCVFVNAASGLVAKTVELPGLSGECPTYAAVSADEMHYAAAAGGVVVAFSRNAKTGEPSPTKSATLACNMASDLEFVGQTLFTASFSEASDSENMAVECFDGTLQRQWVRSEVLERIHDEGGGLHFFTPRIVGKLDAGTGDGIRVVVVLGSRVLQVSMADGSSVDDRDLGLPIIDAFVATLDSGEQAIISCLEVGGIQVLVPGASDADNARLYGNANMSVTKARAFEEDGRLGGVALYSSRARRYGIFALRGLSKIESLERVGSLEGAPQWAGGRLICDDGANIYGLDPNTFERAWSLTPKKLGMGEDVDRMIAIDGSSIVVAGVPQAAGSKGTVRAVEVSAADGSIIRELEVPWPFDTASSAITDIEFSKSDGGPDRLALAAVDNLLVYDLDEQRAVVEVTPGNQAHFIDSWLASDTVLAYRMYGAHGNFALYSLDSGKEISCQLANQSIDESLGHLVVTLGDDRELLVAKCADSAIRAYSAKDGSLVWEALKATQRATFVDFATQDKVIAQDYDGTLDVISAEDGRVMSQSAATLPYLVEGEPRDGQIFIARYGESIEDSTRGIAIFDLSVLDEINATDTLGPATDARFGIYLSQDGTKVLTRVPWCEDYLIYKRYSLEELIAQGKKVVTEFDGQAS